MADIDVFMFATTADKLVLREWYAGSGQYVIKRAPLCEVDAYSNFISVDQAACKVELPSPASRVFRPYVEPGNTAKICEKVCVIHWIGCAGWAVPTGFKPWWAESTLGS